MNRWKLYLDDFWYSVHSANMPDCLNIYNLMNNTMKYYKENN